MSEDASTLAGLGLHLPSCPTPCCPQVVLELIELQRRQEELVKSPVLRSTFLDGKRIDLRHMRPHQLPTAGQLSLRMAGVVLSAYDDAPLSDEDFKSRWECSCLQCMLCLLCVSSPCGD